MEHLFSSSVRWVACKKFHWVLFKRAGLECLWSLIHDLFHLCLFFKIRSRNKKCKVYKFIREEGIFIDAQLYYISGRCMEDITWKCSSCSRRSTSDRATRFPTHFTISRSLKLMFQPLNKIRISESWFSYTVHWEGRLAYIKRETITFKNLLSYAYTNLNIL